MEDTIFSKVEKKMTDIYVIPKNPSKKFLMKNVTFFCLSYESTK